MAKQDVPEGACPRTGRLSQHVAGCYTIVQICGKSYEHTHGGGGCFKKDGTLKCHLTEHTHSIACSSTQGPNCGGNV